MYSILCCIFISFFNKSFNGMTLNLNIYIYLYILHIFIYLNILQGKNILTLNIEKYLDK